MQVVTSVNILRGIVDQAKKNNNSIGFVPTMGNLHGGHISLVEAAREECDIVIVSIFVNPLQFGLNEDLDTYPRTLQDDQERLKKHYCDILFVPSVEEMYPGGDGLKTLVNVPALAQLHCGISRPVFFQGIATVVVKLFNIVQPNRSYFGEKDRQQLKIIQQVTGDLSIPVEVVGVATKRSSSGLALSSRNNYLSDAELTVAAGLYRVLKEVCERIETGFNDFQYLQSEANNSLLSLGFDTDYFHICNSDTLLPAETDDHDISVLAAVSLNGTRLIDNMQCRR